MRSYHDPEGYCCVLQYPEGTEAVQEGWSLAHVAVDTEIIRYVHEVDSRKRTKGESLPWEIVKQSMKNSDIDSGLMALEIEGTMQTLRVSSETALKSGVGD